MRWRYSTFPPAQIVHRERVAERVKRGANPVNVKPPAQRLEIAEQIPGAELAPVPRRKDPIKLVLRDIPVQRLPQLDADRNQPLLVALPEHPQEEIIEIHIGAPQAEQFAYAEAGVERGQSRHLEAGPGESRRFPLQEPIDLLRVEGGMIFCSL